MNDCTFCKIIKGEIPSYTVFEDEIVKVFLDISPDSNGHLLVIPKNHTLDISTIDKDVLSHIVEVAKQMRILLEEKLNVDGITLIQNNGEVQEVKHFHLHIKPFYKEIQNLKEVEDIYKILTN